MAGAERVVIRSSWLGTFSILAPAVAVALAYQIWRGSLDGAWSSLLFLTVVTVLMRYVSYVELTASGLVIHTFGARLVPWHDIGAVEQLNRWGGNQLRIYNVAEQRSRFLPAPGGFVLGKSESAAARDLIERWLLLYRASPRPAPPVRTSPLAGEELDPYRPPAQE